MIDGTPLPGPRAELSARIADDLDARVRAFERAAKRAGRGGHEEAIHDLRVATRRLTEALGVWRTFLDPAAGDDAGKALRRLRKRLGSARDAEVRYATIAELAPRAAGASAPMLELLLEGLERRRVRARARAAKAARPARIARVLEAVDAARAPMIGRIARLADPMREPRGRVEKRHERSDAALARAVGSVDLGVLHEARIAVKKDRYAAECLDAVIGGVDASRIGRLRALQQALGAVQDGAVAAAWIERLEQRALERGRSASAAAFASLREMIESDRVAALSRFVLVLDVGPRAVPSPPAPAGPQATPEDSSAVAPPRSPDERLPAPPLESRSLPPDA